jgi:uncharacterized protein (TIGR02117 family)
MLGNWLHLKLFRIYNWATALRAIAGWPFLCIGIFMTCALIGSIIPVNNSWSESADGIPIFVETNGVHVSLIVPMSAAGDDLSPLIAPQDLADPGYYGTHAMVGWGHSGVYRNAETWADVRSGDIASAVFGSDQTTLHVYHLMDPKPTAYRKQFKVREAEYHAIISQIRAAFRTGANGQSRTHPAYGPDNLFYDSHGHYSAVNTCNNWTGRVLANAGVRVGIWTPFAGSIMRWF